MYQRPRTDTDGLPAMETSSQGALRFKAPADYDGTPEKFPDFAFKFKAYLAPVDKDHQYPTELRIHME